MFMPGHYNLSEEDSNINNIDKLNSTRLKNSVTRVTIKALYTTTHQEWVGQSCIDPKIYEL